MRKLVVGVVGCGGIANGKHLPSIKSNGNFEIVAFCDLIKERAEKAKEEYGTEDARIYTDYQDLVKEDLDAVWAATFEAKAEAALATAEPNGKAEGMTKILEVAAEFTGYNWEH